MHQVYYLDNKGRRLYVTGPEVNSMLMSNRSTEYKDHVRYKKATGELDDLIKEAEANMNIINTNTVEALMYLVNNIEKIKFIQSSKQLQNRHGNITDVIKSKFGLVDMSQIDHFLSKHRIYTKKQMTIFLSILHWLLFVSIFSAIVYLSDLSIGMIIPLFICVTIIIGIFTHVGFLCILNTKLCLYRLIPEYAAMRLANKK